MDTTRKTLAPRALTVDTITIEQIEALRTSPLPREVRQAALDWALAEGNASCYRPCNRYGCNRFAWGIRRTEAKPLGPYPRAQPPGVWCSWGSRTPTIRALRAENARLRRLVADLTELLDAAVSGDLDAEQCLRVDAALERVGGEAP